MTPRQKEDQECELCGNSAYEGNLVGSELWCLSCQGMADGLLTTMKQLSRAFGWDTDQLCDIVKHYEKSHESEVMRLLDSEDKRPGLTSIKNRLMLQPGVGTKDKTKVDKELSAPRPDRLW